MQINVDGAKQYLKESKWPTGLQDSAVNAMLRLPIRFMIIDDSGSMSVSDGQKLLSDGNKTKSVSCTRWNELIQSVRFHVGLSHAAGAITEYRFLNNGAPVVVGRSDDNGAGYHHMTQMLNNTQPSGGTPLCRHVREVTQQIQAMESQLRANGHKAVVVICTDGQSSDGDVAAALAPLKALPVWVVLRLCTGEDAVVDYWNGIDSQLELDMDILDDLESEAKEIAAHNRWFTYGEPLHLLRGFGVNIKELDLLDERALNPDQIRDVCAIILGGNANDYPHPEVNAKEFVRMVKANNAKCELVWNPLTKKMRNWIEVSELKKTVGGGCTIS